MAIKLNKVLLNKMLLNKSCKFAKLLSYSAMKIYLGMSLCNEITNKRSLCKINEKYDFYVNYLGISKNNINPIENNIISKNNDVLKSLYGNCGEDAYFVIKNDRYLIFGK